MEQNTPLEISSPAALNQAISSTKFRFLAWSIYLTGILYYCYAYLLRVYPSVMEINLESHFHINATQLGLLFSSYYFVYAPAQLLVGPTIDRFGPRRSVLFAGCVAVMGTFLFTVSDQFTFAIIGRLLIGFGAAFGYVTALKLAILWLPRRYFAAATGAVTGCGMIIAFTINKYLTVLVQTAGYHTAMHFCFMVGIAIILLVYLVIRDKKPDTKNPSDIQKADSNPLSSQQLVKCLVAIIRNPQMWVIGLIGTLLYLPATVFSDAWGTPYLENVYHFSPDQASTGILIMMIGWTCSSFAAGALSDIFGTRRIPLVAGTILATAVCCTLFYVPGIPQPMVYALLFFLGISCGPHPLCFTLSKENNAPEIAGTAMAFANFVIMMGGFIFQPIVGWLLDTDWTGAIDNGIRVYSSSDYTFALSLIPIGLLVGGILTCFLKETFHTAVESDQSKES